MSANWLIELQQQHALGFFSVALALLVLTQTIVHNLLQRLSRRLTGDMRKGVWLYAAILFPGVLLHELSHYWMATLLRVPTGRFSLRPRLHGNLIELGFVEIYKSRRVGPLHEFLISGAPLLLGSLALIGLFFLSGMSSTFSRLQTASFATTLLPEMGQWQTWLLLYLMFAIGNTMLPSSSDLRAWRGIVLWMGLAAVLFLLLGFGSVEPASVAAFVNRSPLLRYFTFVFGLATLLNCVVMVPLLTMRMLSRSWVLGHPR